MKKNVRSEAALAAAALMVTALAALPASVGAQTEKLDPSDLQIGKPVPEIVGQRVDGEPMRLSDFRGKVIVLDFWGDW